jgi:hypothetical protein
MKKLLVVGVLFAFGMSSCAKDYTCSCEATDASINQDYELNAKKKDAEQACDDLETAGAGIDGWNCELN